MSNPKLRIALIGSGIGCLTAANFLRHHDITVFEQNPSYLGGNMATRVVTVPPRKDEKGKPVGEPAKVPIEIANHLVSPLLYPNLFGWLDLPENKTDSEWVGFANSIISEVRKGGHRRMWSNAPNLKKDPAAPYWVDSDASGTGPEWREAMSRIMLDAYRINPMSEEVAIPLGEWLQSKHYPDGFGELTVYPLYALHFDVSQCPTLLLSGPPSGLSSCYAPYQWFLPSKGFTLAITEPLTRPFLEREGAIRKGCRVIKAVNKAKQDQQALYAARTAQEHTPGCKQSFGRRKRHRTHRHADKQKEGGKPQVYGASGRAAEPASPQWYLTIEVLDENWQVVGETEEGPFDHVVFGAELHLAQEMGFPLGEVPGLGYETAYTYVHTDSSVVPEGAVADFGLLVTYDEDEDLRGQHHVHHTVNGDVFVSSYSKPNEHLPKESILLTDFSIRSATLKAPEFTQGVAAIQAAQGKENVWYANANTVFNEMEPIFINGMWVAQKIDPGVQYPFQYPNVNDYQTITAGTNYNMIALAFLEGPASKIQQLHEVFPMIQSLVQNLVRYPPCAPYVEPTEPQVLPAVPESVDDIVGYVRNALYEYKRTGKLNLIRAVGSYHSVPQAIIAEKGQGWTIVLSHPNFQYIDWVRNDPDAGVAIVRVGAGTHLADDPGVKDPQWLLDADAIGADCPKLLPTLQEAGWAVPDLGGITHQTVSGFLLTGSSGGSTKYDFPSVLTAISFVDGTGEKVTVRRDDPKTREAFLAAGVSMGLFGIVYEVELTLTQRSYNIAGRETTSPVELSHVDLYGERSGEEGVLPLSEFLKQTEYTRLMWWPQPNVETLVVWEATRIPVTPDFTPRPYQETSAIAGSEDITEALAGMLWTAVGSLTAWLQNVNRDRVRAKLDTSHEVALKQLATLFPMALNFLFYGAPAALPVKRVQQFHDTWLNGLPMDNQMDDMFMETIFTELWIDIDQSEAVMRALRDVFKKGTNTGDPDEDAIRQLGNTGTFAFELYAAKASEFLLSPAYKKDVVRVDVFWYGGAEGNPAELFYPRFWKALDGFEYRLHWGKVLDANPTRFVDPDALFRWKAYRAKFDPVGVFATPYWVEKLNLDVPRAVPALPTTTTTTTTVIQPPATLTPASVFPGVEYHWPSATYNPVYTTATPAGLYPRQAYPAGTPTFAPATFSYHPATQAVPSYWPAQSTVPLQTWAPTTTVWQSTPTFGAQYPTVTFSPRAF